MTHPRQISKSRKHGLSGTAKCVPPLSLSSHATKNVTAWAGPPSFSNMSLASRRHRSNGETRVSRRVVDRAVQISIAGVLFCANIHAKVGERRGPRQRHNLKCVLLFFFFFLFLCSSLSTPLGSLVGTFKQLDICSTTLSLENRKKKEEVKCSTRCTDVSDDSLFGSPSFRVTRKPPPCRMYPVFQIIMLYVDKVVVVLLLLLYLGCFQSEEKDDLSRS